MAQRLLMFRSILILAMLSAFFVGCNKTNVKWLHYDETNCSDRWTYDVNNERLKTNVTNYLDDKGVKVLEIEIFANGTKDSCTDCNCKTGRRIKCKVKNRDVSKIKSQGFY